MRLVYIVAGFIILLLSYFVSYTSAAGTPLAGPPVFTINESINNTVAYISRIQNESYFIFYPDLSKAYQYLGDAVNVSSKNATEAKALLSEASSSASQQEQYLSANRPLAFAVAGLLTLISAAALFVVARPMGKKFAKKKRRSQ